MVAQTNSFNKFKPTVSSPLRNELLLASEDPHQLEITTLIVHFEQLSLPFKYSILKNEVDLLSNEQYRKTQFMISLIKDFDSIYEPQPFIYSSIAIFHRHFSELKKEFKATITHLLQRAIKHFKKQLTAINQKIIEDNLAWFIVEKVKGVIELFKKIQTYYNNAINPSDSITEDYHITLNLAHSIFTQSLARRLARFNALVEEIVQSVGFNEKNLQKVEAMNTEIKDYLGFCNELIQTFDIQGPHNLVQYENSYAEIKSKLTLPTLLLKSESEIKSLLISPITSASSFFHLDKGEQTEKEYPTALSCRSPVVS